MPSRSSSDSSKGRGRPSRRSRGGDSNFEGKRSFQKRGDNSEKRSNEGSANSKRPNRPNRSSRFKDNGNEKRNEGRPFSKHSNRTDRPNRFKNSGQDSDRRNDEGASYPKRSSRPTRSTRFNDSGDSGEKRNFERKSYSKPEGRPNRANRFKDGGDTPKKSWRKSFGDDSGSTKPDFKNKRNEGEKFGGKKTYSGDKTSYPKFDKEHFKKKTNRQHDSESATSSEEAAAAGKIRLNKFIANAGVCSRREADELIQMGLISVNGVTITELGHKVNADDEVRHEGKLLRREKNVYILMNKPKGFLTTTSDPEERNTVMHLIGNFVKERVYPVGRLDRNTTGLLLLTNDGDLAEKLMHPSYNVKKIYKVELDRPLTKGDAQRIVDGVRLEEGVAMVDDLAIVSEDRKTVGLEIHIGWNRVVRRIFEALEYEVIKLDRSVYAGLTKKDLGRGEWRFLKKEELVILKHLQ